MNQLINIRNFYNNFYDSSEVSVFVPNTNIKVGKSLYASVNSQASPDFSKIIQNISTTICIDFDNIIGTVSFNYVVVDSEFISTPVLAKITSASGVFTGVFNSLNLNVYIDRSKTNPKRIIYIIYTN